MTRTPSGRPIPSLLLVSAVHHHLLRSANRTKTALVVEAGDVRETHHVAVLIGYGASAVNPYLAMESVEQLIAAGDVVGVTPQDGVYNLIKGLGKGVLKIMSKMGISTVASYTGAQTFERSAWARNWWTNSSPARTPSSAAWAWTSSRPRFPHGTRWPTPKAASSSRTARCWAAASTSGAATASRTCSTRRPSSGCSTPRVSAATTSSRRTPRVWTTSPRT